MIGETYDVFFLLRVYDGRLLLSIKILISISRERNLPLPLGEYHSLSIHGYKTHLLKYGAEEASALIMVTQG